MDTVCCCYSAHMNESFNLQCRCIPHVRTLAPVTSQFVSSALLPVRWSIRDAWTSDVYRSRVFAKAQVLSVVYIHGVSTYVRSHHRYEKGNSDRKSRGVNITCLEHGCTNSFPAYVSCCQMYRLNDLQHKGTSSQ